MTFGVDEQVCIKGVPTDAVREAKRAARVAEREARELRARVEARENRVLELETCVRQLVDRVGSACRTPRGEMELPDAVGEGE